MQKTTVAMTFPAHDRKEGEKQVAVKKKVR
jgi:hypothetical protein